LVVALGSLAVSLALSDLGVGRSDRRRKWSDARRGDLSLVALACVLCSNALLVAALFAGIVV
jgi:hypothetical protein